MKHLHINLAALTAGQAVLLMLSICLAAEAEHAGQKGGAVPFTAVATVVITSFVVSIIGNRLTNLVGGIGLGGISGVYVGGQCNAGVYGGELGVLVGAIVALAEIEVRILRRAARYKTTEHGFDRQSPEP